MNNADLIKSLPTTDEARMKAYKENLDFYNGEQWLYQNRRERRLTFNYARVSIDKLTSYMMAGMNFSVSPRDESQGAKAEEAEKALYEVYE
ncbi:MAG: portal protein, partial [Dehalococcoidia bacterium]|nr:portal protein [Dehalococcoidia bacterium]